MTDAKPQPTQTPATAKGANPGKMPPPLSPNGPNETENGVIIPRPQVGPGTDGLLGGPGYSGMTSAGAFADELNRSTEKERAKAAIEAIEAEQQGAQERQEKLAEQNEKEIEAREKWEKEAVKSGGDGTASTKRAFEMTKEEIENRTPETGGGRYKK